MKLLLFAALGFWLGYAVQVEAQQEETMTPAQRRAAREEYKRRGQA